jgi:alanine-glyoxylate transaminase/serine-glyoxylate transaminase/serine-pyruvate transaminase
VRKIQPDALLIVDGVCASAGEECRATEWDIDYVMTGSQKCIGVPSGLSISMVRPRALKVNLKS